MKLSNQMLLAALFAATAFVASTKVASAAIVCNREGECWHVHHHYAYAPGYGVVVHPNSWRWGPGEHYVWREHPGRGYWRGGVWIAF